MASKKGSKEVVQLRNAETGVFYITTKNTKKERKRVKNKANVKGNNNTVIQGSEIQK